jgi:hypothetical protein
VRHAIGCGTNCHDNVAFEFAGTFHDAVGKGCPVQVWLDTRNQNQISRSFGEPRYEKLIFGPSNLALTIFVNKCLWTLLGEVKKWVGVDGSNNGDGAILNGPLQSASSHACNVKPAPQGNYENGVSQRLKGIPVTIQHITYLHGRSRNVFALPVSTV